MSKVLPFSRFAKGVKTQRLQPQHPFLPNAVLFAIAQEHGLDCTEDAMFAFLDDCSIFVSEVTVVQFSLTSLGMKGSWFPQQSVENQCRLSSCGAMPSRVLLEGFLADSLPIGDFNIASKPFRLKLSSRGPEQLVVCAEPSAHHIKNEDDWLCIMTV